MPIRVAEAIVALLAKPRRRVTVTRAAGAVLVLQRLLPGAVAGAMRRAFGLDKLFVDRVDATQRRAYDNRVCAR